MASPGLFAARGLNRYVPETAWLAVCNGQIPRHARGRVPEAPMPKDHASAKVLVVDDQHDVTTIIGRWLSRKGFEVQTVNDSREAIDVLRRFHPDAVILDISMPFVDGYEVARQVRAEPGFADIPMVACTTFQSGHHLLRAKAMGFTHHIPKPCDLPKLQALLEELGLGHEARH